MVAHESGLSHPTAALGLWARRIVSEDSVHSIAPLSAAVHPFPESKNLGVVLVAEAVFAPANPDKKLPSELDMASMHGLSC